MDPDPAIFVINLQDANKKQLSKKKVGIFKIIKTKEVKVTKR
jgi:hypothetical protein